MFGVSKEYVIRTTSGLEEKIVSLKEYLENEIWTTDKPKVKELQDRQNECDATLNSIQEKLEDIKFYKEQLERECHDRARQEQESIEWNRKNMRLECVRMATQSLMGHRSEQVLAHASSLMEFIETGKVPESPLVPADGSLNPKTKGK
jgi:predicted nuclease with TOPRIM domain